MLTAMLQAATRSSLCRDAIGRGGCERVSRCERLRLRALVRASASDAATCACEKRWWREGRPHPLVDAHSLYTPLAMRTQPAREAIASSVHGSAHLCYDTVVPTAPMPVLVSRQSTQISLDRQTPLEVSASVSDAVGTLGGRRGWATGGRRWVGGRPTTAASVHCTSVLPLLGMQGQVGGGGQCEEGGMSRSASLPHPLPSTARRSR